ncbi:MAG: hypothetical protein ACSHXK_14475 [Oceanococcus sp.]
MKSLVLNLFSPSFRFGFLCLSLALGACASHPVTLSVAGGGACLDLFQQADAAVIAAGVQDAGEHRVGGFPWARSNRFLASFADELQPKQIGDWLTQLRQLDQQARRYELSNLNAKAWSGAQLGQLERCGSLLMAETLADPLAMQTLRVAVAVPDDYSLLARTAGAYALTMPFLRMGVLRYHDEVKQGFSADLPAAQGQWRLWRVSANKVTPAIDWKAQERDAIGVPQLSNDQLQMLFEQHAPSFLIDENGDFDRPGTPLPSFSDQEPGFDPTKPVIHYKLVWTRFGQEVLPQLVYTLWFSERPAQSWLDSYAGNIDGVMWRVTLDSNGQVLMHDTVHACGCYHYHFPAQNLPRMQHQDVAQEPLLFPQGQVPWDEIAVVLQSETHYVLRVLPTQTAEKLAQSPAKVLYPQDYDDLRSVQQAAGQWRSLFAPNGLIAGTQRLERWWLWPSGVPSPGAMRQWGRHATAFVGRAHFDDPYFLEKLGLNPP